MAAEERPWRAVHTENHMKNGKKGTTKKTGTLRPWLVDVQVEHLR